MSISKVNVIAIIACFVVFQHVQTDAAEFNIDSYLGTWHVVGLIFFERIEPNPILCEWSEVTPLDDDDDGFTIETNIRLREKEPVQKNGHGTIDGSNIRIDYSDGKQDNYGIVRYNYDHDLILRFEDCLECSALISRNLTASEQAIAAFESLAVEIGGGVVAQYIDNINCASQI